MRGIPLALGAALIASLAFNLVLYRDSAQEVDPSEERSRGREAVSTTVPSSLPATSGRAAPTADSSQLLAEIRQLRADLAASRGSSSSAPVSTPGEKPPVRKAADELPPAIALDPVIMNALAERDATRQASSRFWRDLDRVYEVKDAIGVVKFREVMSRLTADFLGMDGSGGTAFVSASTQAADELDRAEIERKETDAKLRGSVADRDTRKRLEEGMETRYLEQKQAAIGRLEPYLRGTPFQLDLKGKSGSRWVEYLRGR